MGEGHRIGLVAHAHPLQLIAASVAKSVANDALDALAGIDVFLDGDFVGCVFLEEAANADIETFSVLAEDHEAHVVSGTVAKRRKPVVEKFDRASIHKEDELEAKSEKDLPGVLIGSAPRIPHTTANNPIYS